MTGGGFYVVSFVSCSSCFMLKFSGRYVIKLLGVWRAQAPLFLITGAVPAVGQMSVWPVSVHHHCPCQWLSWVPFWMFFYSEAQIPAFVRRQLEFQGGCGPTLDINCPAVLWTSILNSGWATCLKMAKPSYCSGSWMAVGRACCQWEMLHYGNKITSESSPSLLPSQRHLLWLFSDHFCCKIRHKSRFEILVQCFCVQMLANIALSICCEGL